MKLTVVVTTYNQEKYIGQAIDGILMQKTDFPFKLIISNDCSTDGTLAILQEYQKNNPEIIEVINNEKNLGPMNNFINTLSIVKDSEYVALCDGDDFWTDENKLQKQVDFLDENKDFNICWHKSKLFYQNGEKEEQIIPQNIPEVTSIEDLVNQNYIVANSVVYRWKFNDENLKDVFPNDVAPGDYYIHLLHAQDGKIKMIDEVMSAYRRHNESMWWSNDEDKEKFILGYGRKFLNFYNSADKYMKLPPNAFYAQRKDIIYNIIVTYTKNDKFEKVKEEIISNKDKELFNECMKDIVNRNIWYLDYLIQQEQQKKQEVEQEIQNEKKSRWEKFKEVFK